MSTEILVRLDGESEPLTLDELTWEHVAPCGCTCGVMNADQADRDVAFKHFLPNAEMRKRDQAAGFLFRLARRDEAIDRIRNRCEHTPQWGIDRVPIPDGYRWGETWSPKRLHLVPVPVDAEKYRWVVTAERLCDSKRDCYSHGNTVDVPTCQKCEKRARELAATWVES